MATWIEPFLTPDILKNHSFPSYTTQFTVQRHPKLLTSPCRYVLCSFKQTCICFPPFYTNGISTTHTVVTYLVTRHFCHPQRKHHKH